MNIIVTVLIAWLTSGIIGAGFMNAALRAPRDVNPNFYQPSAAKTQAFSLVGGITLGPIFFIISMAESGFGKTGWTLSRDVVLYYVEQER